MISYCTMHEKKNEFLILQSDEVRGFIFKGIV